MVNVSRLKFKLGAVNNFSVGDISLSDKNTLKDFNPLDIIKLTAVATKGELPVSFTLNVEAKNPNDGKEGYSATDITLKSFPWRLLIDEKETIKGNIGSPVIVPGKGESTVIPVQIELDLLKFFNEQGFESIMNLALSLGGKKASTSRLKMIAQPVLGTPLGDIQYPDEITIVDHQFN